MRKLLILLFSILLSFNSYANNVCYADVPHNSHLLLESTMMASSGKFDTFKEIGWDELLSVCKVGDVVSMEIVDYSDTKNFEELKMDWLARKEIQYFIQGYCDLTETVIINNMELVCRVVELRQQK
jgi:hypothetical protein